MNTDEPWPDARRGRGPGYCGCRPSCTNGRPTALIVGSVTCSTSSADPAFLVVAWHRVRGNRGARSAGVDGVKPSSILFGDAMLAELRDDLKARTLHAPSRAGTDDPQGERQTPPPGHPDRPGPGRAGHPEAGPRADLRGGLQAVQLRLPPEAPSPGRHRRDPPARHPTPMSGCSKATSRRASTRSTHTALMDRVRHRIGDKRVLALVKAFLKSGILTEDGVMTGHEDRHPPRRHPLTAARQHRPLGPRRALRRGLGVEHGHSTRRATGADARRLANYRMSDMRTTSWSWCPAPRRTPRHCGRRWRRCLSDGPPPVGGKDDDRPHRRGVRLPRLPHPAADAKRGSNKAFVYTLPSKKSLASIKAKVKAITRQGTNQPTLRPLAPVELGVCEVGPPTSGTACPRRPSPTCTTTRGSGSSRWLRRKHRRANWKQLRRRYLGNGWWPSRTG